MIYNVLMTNRTFLSPSLIYYMFNISQCSQFTVCTGIPVPREWVLNFLIQNPLIVVAFHTDSIRTLSLYWTTIRISEQFTVLYSNQIDIDSTIERLQHEHNYHWETTEHNLNFEIWKCRFIFNHHHCILKVDWYLLSFLWIKLFTLSKWLEWSKILNMYT